MSVIVNLTQHAASPEQRAAGVIDLRPEALDELRSLLTFEELPESCDVEHAAGRIVVLLAHEVAMGHFGTENGEPITPDMVMIGGAPFLMAPLERALIEQGFTPCYAFSRRESVERTDADGSVRKTAVFRHLGFVEV